MKFSREKLLLLCKKTSPNVASHTLISLLKSISKERISTKELNKMTMRLNIKLTAIDIIALILAHHKRIKFGKEVFHIINLNS